MKYIHLLIIIITLLLSCNKNDDSDKPLYSSLDEEISVMAKQYVKVGAMVGVIDKNQNKHVLSYGTKSKYSTELPDANTVFDIGSITKTFTAILATNMILKGRLANDKIQHYLPENEVTMPRFDGVEITINHLLTHMSGLPRTPHVEDSTFPRPQEYDSENPYAAYTTEDIYNYLTNYCSLKFKPGTFWEYSNTGFGLLGHTLGLIDGTSYETILKRDIFDVLGMNNSSLFLTEQQQLNKASGHNSNKDIVPFYTANDIFQGAGMIKSSLHDMFKYLEANMGLSDNPLLEAMEKTHKQTPGINTGSLGYIGLAWFIIELDDGQDIIYSGGDTNGHSVYMAFNPSTSTGAIILMNASYHDNTNLNFGHALMMAINKY